ncbi:MAG: epimerase [Myxococcales bacterium]|nr:epimerase [Myxococcales bacterium]
MKVLVTGISSAIGRMLTRRLLAAGWQVIGIDRRPWPDAPEGVEVFRADIRKRPAEEVFRTHRPKAVIHMATVSHFTTSFEERYRINLGGTQAVFDNCERYGVEQAIFVGRHTVYGAMPDAPMYHSEEDPPLGGSTFPELADLVAADLYAGSALWRMPELDTVVLRIVYTLGPSRYGNLARFLETGRVPTVMGFDPLYQFIHEEDAAQAIAVALQQRLRGIYNVAGPQPVPLSLLIKISGGKAWPIPEPLYNAFLGRFGLPKLPAGAINHIKHPVVLDASAFREATDYTHQFDEVQTMNAFRWA